nr:cyclin-dependent protein kinase inhibitor SMR5 [Ipomoea batatas]
MEDAINKVSDDEAELAGCRTPDREECRIPAMKFPPPPPRKKRLRLFGKKEVPKSAYFHSPELELFLTIPLRRRTAITQLVE